MRGHIKQGRQSVSVGWKGDKTQPLVCELPRPSPTARHPPAPRRWGGPSTHAVDANKSPHLLPKTYSPCGRRCRYRRPRRRAPKSSVGGERRRERGKHGTDAGAAKCMYVCMYTQVTPTRRTDSRPRRLTAAAQPSSGPHRKVSTGVHDRCSHRTHAHPPAHPPAYPPLTKQAARSVHLSSAPTTTPLPLTAPPTEPRSGRDGQDSPPHTPPPPPYTRTSHATGATSMKSSNLMSPTVVWSVKLMARDRPGGGGGEGECLAWGNDVGAVVAAHHPVAGAAAVRGGRGGGGWERGRLARLWANVQRDGLAAVDAATRNSGTGLTPAGCFGPPRGEAGKATASRRCDKGGR